jgi:subtilisin family serine protease
VRRSSGLVGAVCALTAIVVTAVGAEPPRFTPAASADQSVIIRLSETGDQEVPGLLVKFREGVNRIQREQALAGLGRNLRHYTLSNVRTNSRRGPPFFDQLVSADLDERVGLKQALRVLQKNGLVEYVEPNLPLAIVGTTPSDADYHALWGLHNDGQTGGTPDADIDMPEAWDLTTGSTSVVVAVIDTGIDYGHPDLAANMWVNPGEVPGNEVDDDGNGFVDDLHGYDFYNSDGDPLDAHFHGTHCAGTIGAVGNNSEGVAGVNWNTSLMALKFLNASGSGYTDDAVAAIQYAINNGADVLSNSWGGGGYSQILQDAVREAQAAGLVFIAAAGNNGSDAFVYPAAYDDVIAVSATDHKDIKAGFSSYGAFVDVAAPGVNIYSTDLGGGYRYASGTSMACPHVAGLAALLWSADPTLTPSQLEQVIETSADDLGAVGWDTQYGSGRINALQALQTAIQQPADLPKAVIESPGQAAVISGATLSIIGTAAGVGLADFRLEYADRSGTDWQLITSGTMPVESGVLADWNISEIDDGDYLIRLTVTDASGRKSYDAIGVTLDNFEARIAFPSDLVSMGSVEIRGSAATLNDVPFDHYALEWGTGTAPSTFYGSGITLAGGGLQPVNDDVLATWDTSTLSDGQTYTLRLRLYSTTGLSTEYRITTKADGELVKQWPRIIPFDTQPSIADLDGDGAKEIIVAGKNSALVHAYRKDGSELDGFPSSPADDIVQFSPEGHATVVDIDRQVDSEGRTTREILVGALRETSQGYSYGLFVIGSDGAPYPGWITPTLAKAPLVPVAADMNGDGVDEIVTIEIARWSLGYSDYRIHAFDRKGSEIDGFPVVQSIEDISGTTPYLSVHDLDNDGLPELALLQNDQVLLFDHRGALLSGWPYRVPSLPSGDLAWFDGVLTSGDIDGDGLKELVALSSKACEQLSGSSYVCYIGAYSTLYAWEKDASVVPGFPRTTDSDGFVSWQATAVPVVDVDYDGVADLLPGTDPFMIFDGTGNQVAVSSLRSAGPLSVADVDGDGLFEYASGKSKLQVFTETGAVMWSRTVSEDLHYAGMLLADLEGDGRMEIIKALPGVNAETNRVDADYYHLYVWEPDLDGIAGADWPMYAKNARRDGNLGDGYNGREDLLPPAVTITSPTDGTTLPANDGRITIDADASDTESGIGRVEFLIDAANACTDDMAPYTCATTLTAGTHTLTARAIDRAGNSRSHSISVERPLPDTTPPTVTILSPQDGEALPPNGLATIEATAVDSDSGIDRMEFAVDDASVCILLAPPYVCETRVQKGVHVITASAFDKAGLRADAMVSVSRGEKPGR